MIFYNKSKNPSHYEYFYEYFVIIRVKLKEYSITLLKLIKISYSQVEGY